MRSRSTLFTIALLTVGGLAPSPAETPPSAPPLPAAPVAVSSAPGPVVQQTAGLTQEIVTSYEVRPELPATRVEVSAVLTHTRPDDGDVYYYWDSFWVFVPGEADNLTGRAGGTAVAVAVDTDDAPEGFKRAGVVLDPALRYGQTRDVTLSYDLGPQPDRAVATLSQANVAFFMFPVLPVGDPGRARVDVRIPAEYDVTVLGDELTRHDTDDEVVLSAEAIGAPAEFGATVLAMDESRLVTEVRDTAVGPVELHAWPGDTEWVEFVVDHVDRGAPVLGELLGLPWPEDGPLTIRETMTPVAQGYGGWYEPAEHQILIGNELDAHIVLHELSHVWLNFDLLEERWALEGFAEEYAARALDELGRPQVEDRPTPADVSDRPVALVEWSDPSFGEDTDHDLEAFGYGASWYVIGSIADEVGPEAMQDVIAAAADSGLTYEAPTAPAASVHLPTDWRALLDLFENVAGSTAAADLFAAYVIPEEQLPELEERSTARDVYEDLVGRGGDWAAPFAVRRDLSYWAFDAALDGIHDADAVLVLRDKIYEVLAGSDAGVPGLRDEYETADDMGEVRAAAEVTLDAAEAYRAVELRDRPSGLPAAIGLWGRGIDGRLDEARWALEAGDPATALALSESAARRLDTAGRVGAQRIVVGVALLTGAGIAGARLRRRVRSSAAEG